MKRLCPLVLLVALAVVASRSPLRAQDADPTGSIPWRGGPEGVFAAADRENRPVFIVVATLADGAGNEALATRVRDPGVVATATSFVSLVASRHRHGAGEKCERYGGSCTDHQAVMAWVVGRFGVDVGSLTAPRHLILNPDGTVFARLPYGTAPAKLRSELERSLASAAPRHALALVPSARRDVLEALRAGTTEPLAYAKGGDPLAPAVLLHLWVNDVERRERWTTALASLPASAFPTLRLELRQGTALLGAATAVDAARGAWWKRFRGTERSTEIPPPHEPALAAAFAKLKAGDASELEPLLDALTHPVDGPEVRTALTGLLGRDLGADADAWRKELTR